MGKKKKILRPLLTQDIIGGKYVGTDNVSRGTLPAFLKKKTNTYNNFDSSLNFNSKKRKFVHDSLDLSLANGNGAIHKKLKIVENGETNVAHKQNISFKNNLIVNGVQKPILYNKNKVKNVYFTNGSRSKSENKTDNFNLKGAADVKLDRNAILSQRKNLPLFAYKDELIDSIQKSETAIIISETGSGKTTQLPQYIYEKGLLQEGIICITQPRRVAAITIAKRVSEEVGCKIGNTVGYSVRFEDAYSPKTKIKFVTDGMLLREALSDSLLKKYKWILLDEAHERSINTDILFGIVKAAQRKRKKKNIPLNIIVMSATMDVDHFSSYFNNAPVIYIEGRQHHVEVLSAKKEQSDYVLACLSTVLKIHKEAKEQEDILIFLTGQEEIDYAVKLLENLAKDSKLSDYPKLKAYPLYAALPYHKQFKIFSKSSPGERKVIISTNIAETSVTIPGVKYVIDSGRVKVRTYNSNSGFDVLKVCKISQAQAWQRTGRAGRESSGICYRVYTNEEFQNLNVNTVPEILRANLASVLLRILAIGIKNILKFDFLDKPKKENLMLAQNDLKDLKAIEIINELAILTDLGKKMAMFPLEPHYAKLLINGPTYSCTEEILTIIALLSSESIFVNPSEKRDEANEKREKFSATEGDHIILLNIFNSFTSSSNKKIWCRKNFLNLRNLSYASDVRRQLQDLCVKNNIPLMSCNGKTEPVLRCLVSGLYKNIGEKDFRSTYRIMNSGESAKIHPSSKLFGFEAEYILFTEIVKTEKTYMCINSEVRPEWLMEFDEKYFRSKRIKKTKSEKLTYVT